MPYLVETSKMPAIPKGAYRLKAMTYEEGVMLDEKKDALIQRNGGFADWLLEIRRGIFTFLRISNESYPFKPNK